MRSGDDRMTLPRLSLHRKLILLSLAATVLGLTMAALGLALYERHTFRSDRANELTLLANTVAANAAASMVFSDSTTAGDILDAVRADHGIIAARLYDARGRIFAEYVRADLPQSYTIPQLPPDGVVFHWDSVVLTQAVWLQDEREGSIVMISDLRSLNGKYLQYAQIVALVLVVSLHSTYIFASRLLRMAIAPILHLESVARKVSSKGDYSLRSPAGGNDEIGSLIYSFNDMLDVIQQRDTALLNAKDELESRVAQRTAALEEEIEERKAVEQALRWNSAFLEAQVNSTVEGVLVVAPDKQILLLNQQFIDIMKLPAHIVEENRYAALRDHVLTIVKNPEPFRERLDYLYDHPAECSSDEIEFADGTVLDRHSAPVRGKDGHYYGKLWTFRDITQRKRTEEALFRAKEALSKERQVLRTMIDNVPDFMFVKDTEGRFLVVNAAVAKRAGFASHEQLIGKTAFDVFPSQLAVSFLQHDRKVMETRQPYLNSEELLFTKGAGDPTWVLTTKVPLFDEQGKVIGLAGIARDITEIKRTQEDLFQAKEALAQERQVLRTLIDNVPDFMYVKDTHSRFLVANNYLAQTCGLRSPVEVLGKTDFDFYPAALANAYYQDEQRLIANKRPLFNQEEECRDPAGNTTWLLTTKVPLFDEKGEVTGLAGIGRDITARKRAESEWQRAKEAAEATSRAKSEFLANMSHEIRTPLNGIIGMTDLALDTDITSEQREYLDTVKLSAESLLTVINDILDFSKVEAGKLELEFQDFNLRDCLGSTLKTLALRADEKGLELLCQIAPATPEFVCGDSSRLRQVIVNLVGNAIKFTHRGQVQLEVAPESSVYDDHRLHFVVSDTGVGIPPEKQRLIFQPFSQADSSTTRKYGGTGLGLSISTSLVELMGGGIWVESEPGAGSRFHFTVLLKPSTAKTEAIPPASPESLRGVKVLVVDDNTTNLRILHDVLSRWEMQPAMAQSGEEALTALELARQQSVFFPLILVDLHMPGMDGFTLIERIRQHPPSPSEIVMLTSSRHRKDAERCRALGVAAYLLKPIRQSELREALARVLSARNHPAADAGALSPSQETAASVQPLSILVAEDNAVNQRLIVRLLEKRGHRVKLAANGLEALQFAEQESFDLVLMDIQMPEMDGLMATARIRERELASGNGHHLPIIALTAHAMKGDQERFLAAGMDGYLSKPLHPKELDEILAAQIASRSHSFTDQPSPDPQAAPH